MGKKIGYLETLKSVYKNEGFMTLYKGAWSAGIGSVVFRATGFSAFELAYTRFQNDGIL